MHDDAHLTLLDAAAAQSWVTARHRFTGTTTAQPEDFARQSKTVQLHHRLKVAPQVAAVLRALAPMLAPGPGIPGAFDAGQESCAELVRDLADDVEEEAGS